MKSIKKNYIYSLIYNATLVIIPLLITPYLSRILGVEGVGIKSYTLSIVSFFILLSNLGVATYGQQEIAKNRDNKDKYSQIFYEIIILRFISTLLFVTFYFIAFVLPIFNQDYNLIFLILVINLIANALDFSWFLQGLEEFKKIAIFQVISKLLYCACIFIFIKSQADLPLCIFLTSLSLLFTALLTTVTAIKYCRGASIGKLRPHAHLKESLVFFVPAIAVQIYTVLDKTMIGLIAGTYENGYYEQADKIIQICFSLCTSLNVVMRSRMSYLFKKNDIKNIKQILLRSIRFTEAITIPMVFGIIGTAPIFVPIFFGQEFSQTATILSIIAPVLLIAGISNLLGSHYFTPSGRRRLSNRGLIIGAVINLIANSILIPHFASNGAAIGTILAESTITIIYIFYARKIISLHEILQPSLKYIFSGTIMLTVILALRAILGDSVITLIVLVTTGILVYFMVLYITRDTLISETIKLLKTKVNSNHVIKK